MKHHSSLPVKSCNTAATPEAGVHSLPFAQHTSPNSKKATSRLSACSKAQSCHMHLTLAVWSAMQAASTELDSQAGKVPTAWIPPYKGPSQRLPPRSTSGRRLPPSYSPSHSSEASSMNTRSRFNLSGLGGVLTSPSVHSGWAGQQSSIGSSPQGMTDAGQVAALFQESTRSANRYGVCLPTYVEHVTL